jgi:hypothetical protein
LSRARQANHRIRCSEFARWPDFGSDEFADRVKHQHDTRVHFFAFISRVFDVRQLDIDGIGLGIVSHGSHRRAPRSKNKEYGGDHDIRSCRPKHNPQDAAAALWDAAPGPAQRWIVRIDHKSCGLSYRGLNPCRIDGITHDIVSGMTGQE